MYSDVTRKAAHTLAVVLALLIGACSRQSVVDKKTPDAPMASAAVGTSGTTPAPDASQPATPAATDAAATDASAAADADAAADSANAGPGKAVERDADSIRALEEMSTYLRTLKAFQVHVATSRDEVLEDGQNVTFSGTVDMIAERPNHLRAEVINDKQHRMYFDDGKTFSVWARRVNYYATIPAPPTLRELAEKLTDQYNLELPVADLFYWGDRKNIGDVVGAIDVGAAQVDGTTCEHYAFRQEGADWQLWIQQGDYPLPRKMVITTTTDPSRPRFTSVMTWNLAPSFDAAAFTFEPPKDAKRIMLAQAPTGDSQ